MGLASWLAQLLIPREDNGLVFLYFQTIQQCNDNLHSPLKKNFFQFNFPYATVFVCMAPILSSMFTVRTQEPRLLNGNDLEK